MDKIPALALANMLRYAFLAGAGYGDFDQITPVDRDRWLQFGSDSTIPHFAAIERAIKEYNENRTTCVNQENKNV